MNYLWALLSPTAQTNWYDGTFKACRGYKWPLQCGGWERVKLHCLGSFRPLLLHRGTFLLLTALLDESQQTLFQSLQSLFLFLLPTSPSLPLPSLPLPSLITFFPFLSNFSLPPYFLLPSSHHVTPQVLVVWDYSTGPSSVLVTVLSSTPTLLWRRSKS